jgi:Holliday junction resolvasome RuvABC endonuclease subunit
MLPEGDTIITGMGVRQGEVAYFLKYTMKNCRVAQEWDATDAIAVAVCLYC